MSKDRSSLRQRVNKRRDPEIAPTEDSVSA